jgi:hypothetical protein
MLMSRAAAPAPAPASASPSDLSCAHACAGFQAKRNMSIQTLGGLPERTAVSKHIRGPCHVCLAMVLIQKRSRAVKGNVPSG